MRKHRSFERRGARAPLRRAFTLPEILIVLTLFVIIGMLISQSLVSGTKEFSALTGDLELNSSALRIVAAICRDIRACTRVNVPKDPIDDTADPLFIADPTFRLTFVPNNDGLLTLGMNKRDPADPQQHAKPWTITWTLGDQKSLSLAGGSQTQVYKLHRTYVDDQNNPVDPKNPDQVFPPGPKDEPYVSELVFRYFKTSKSLVRVRLKLQQYRKLPGGVSVPAYVAEVESAAHLRDQGGS